MKKPFKNTGHSRFTDPKSEIYIKIKDEIQKGLAAGEVNSSKIAKELGTHHTGVLRVFSHMIKNFKEIKKSSLN